MKRNICHLCDDGHDILLMSCTVICLAGSYDQNTLRGALWQVQSQGANADKCTGSQLQLASMANQGNAKPKKTHTAVDVKNGHAKKLARGLTSYHG